MAQVFQPQEEGEKWSAQAAEKRQPVGPSNQEIGFEEGDGNIESLHDNLESLTFQFPQPNQRGWPIRLRWAPESGKPTGE